jgi:hypothetical protein
MKGGVTEGGWREDGGRMEEGSAEVRISSTLSILLNKGA